jgi:hypothetical protein
MACWAWLALLAAAEEPKAPNELKLTILQVKPVDEAPGDDALRKLVKARFNCAVEEVRYHSLLYKAGRTTVDSFYSAGRRLTDAELDLLDKAADRVACLERFVELTRVIDEIADARLKAGSISAAEREVARGRRLEAEIRLERERRGK